MVAKRKQFDNSEVLLTMMERATNLRNLKIHRCDRYLADTRFMQAIRAMRHLDRLYINVGKQESHQHVADLMHGLTSSLKTMEYPAVIDGDDPIPQALFHSLSKLQPQLETLCIAIQSLTPPTQPSPFLHVRVLDLTVTLGNSTTLEQLVSVFPRLQELSIFMYDSQLADVNNPSTEMVAARNAAAALQESGRGWPRLDRLGGLIADLYVLACPVSKLQLLNYYEDAHPAFCDVISRTRPSRVDLDLFCSAWLEVGAVLPTILVYGDERDPGAVTHLVVRLTVTASPPTPSSNMVVSRPKHTLSESRVCLCCHRRVQGTIAPFLQNSRVEYLHLAIGRMFSTDEIDEDFLTPRAVDAELKTTMDGIDVGYLVSSLVACGTCLRTVVLSLATRDQSVWTVDKVEGQRTWRRLDAYAGRMVVAREEAAVM